MASIYDLKPAFQRMWRPLVGRLAAWGVRPNQVTLLAFSLSLGLGLALALAPQAQALWLLVPAWMFFRMALNAIDGMLAREHQMQTPLGGLLNELTDPLADAALVLPFALLAPLWSPLIVGVTVLAFATELAGTAAVGVGASRRFEGPMGKSDRAAVFGVLALLHGVGVPLGLWSNVLLALVLGLTGLTVARRCMGALEEVRS